MSHSTPESSSSRHEELDVSDVDEVDIDVDKVQESTVSMEEKLYSKDWSWSYKDPFSKKVKVFQVPMLLRKLMLQQAAMHDDPRKFCDIKRLTRTERASLPKFACPECIEYMWSGCKTLEQLDRRVQSIGKHITPHVFTVETVDFFDLSF